MRWVENPNLLQAAHLELAFLHRHQTGRIENKRRRRLQPDGGYLANTKTHDRFRGKTLPDHHWVFVRTGLGGGGVGEVQLNHKKGIKVALEGGNYTLLFPTFQPL